jgi:hypothetical protein
MGFLLLAALLAYAGLSPIEETKQGDALILAIDYFDPGHERCLRQWGDEHYFILSALRACEESFPELAFIAIPKSFKHSIHRSFSAVTTIVLRVDPGDYEWVSETAERIGSGCRGYVDEHHSGPLESERIIRETTWYLKPSHNKPGSPMGDWLASIGFVTMTLEEWPERGRAGLYFTRGPADIDCVLNRLHTDPYYADVFGDRRFERYGTVRGSAVTDIQVIPDDREPDFERDFSLAFSCRIRNLRHRWVVRCRPTGERHGTGFGFEVSLVEDTGDAIPPTIWFDLGYWMVHLGSE